MRREGRPNFLLIMVDQLAARWLPAYGNAAVHAPALTNLAARGITFDAAYCSAPLCAPSRSAMLTGRHCSRIGVFDNAAELPASTPTLAHHLRAAGYTTTLVGKMHFVGPDQLHGFEHRLTTDVYPAGLDWTPDWTAPPNQRLSWYHSMESVLTPERCVASMQTDYDDEVAFHAVRHIYDLARQGRLPFLLVVSFTNPHDPWELPARYWDLYDSAQIPLPAVAKLPLEQVDPHSRRLRTMCGVDEVELDPQQVRRARHGYFAAISYADERIAAVLEALRRVGFDEHTTIVFTSDHGEFLGERGLWYKMSLLESSARIPLIVRAPGAQPRRIPEPVSHLDLLPTILELADVQGEEIEVDGVSLAAALSGGAAPPNRAVLAEYLAEGVTAPGAMIRDGRHKLIVCPGDPDQLFDLDADPHELRNLARSAEHKPIRRSLHERLASRLDLGQIEAQVLASQRERHLVAAALARGEVTAWDFQPHVDASMQYVRSRSDLYELQRRARLAVDGQRAAPRRALPDQP
jgi:choline-sulfatase